MGHGDELYFPVEHLDKLNEVGKWMQYPKDTILCKAGEVPRYCYYIGSGQVTVYEYTANGGEHVFNTINAGCLFLIPSMMITHAVTLSFKTSQKSEILRIPKNGLYQLIMSDPEISADLIYSLSARMIDTMEQLKQSGNYTVTQRVCSLLIERAERFGVEYDGKIMIQEKISQQSIANRIQANRVTVARSMKSLKDLGLVELVNGYYCVRDIEKLRRHIEYLSQSNL